MEIKEGQKVTYGEETGTVVRKEGDRTVIEFDVPRKIYNPNTGEYRLLERGGVLTERLTIK